MNNNVQVNLQFTANTAQAKQELANLQTQLTSLINQPVPIGAKMTTDIQKATAAAAELKVHLQNATNVKTGMLDFGKLNQSIKQSGMTLSQYGAQLQSLGPQGQQAFMQLANSVAAAEVPIRRASGALTGMMTTFKNTAKWMVSSTVLTGFIQTISSAYGYAKDLNESLNNIRIVTGQNIDQMAKFAAEANKAAKALSTTTTEYTNASLIYYQQGLSDQQVKERTDVTIKMANVSRQSAEVVSDQMTAVWNNFYDGSKSLESYADALTALGAATASSTDEIAQGLEKFAAIADTVGLSYEYATAALATVTAQTRQSADVVGTAFKTLFARIQDLKLGETLDDGTTLGQYSAALMKVGVDIKGANGELKDMDTILNEIGAKWQNLERDEQAALAKAVGGLRQYNQFIALMDNWDFMQENLEVVENSTGTLQKQADTYAESWEAASKRVKASAEEVYSKLLNDKFFIELNNGLADFIGFLGKAIDGLGGVKGLLLMLGTIATKVFSTQIAQGLRNMTYNMQMMTKSGQQAVQAAKQREMDAIRSQMTSYSATGLADQTAQSGYTQQLEAQSYIIENAHKLTDMEKNKAQILLDQANYMAKQSVEYAKQLELLKEQRTSQAMNIRTTLGAAGMSQDDITSNLTGLRNTGEKMGAVDSAVRNLDSIFASSNNNAKQLNAAIEQLDNAINGLGDGEDTVGLKKLMTELKGMRGETDNAKSKLAEISGELNVFGAKAIDSSVDLKGLEQRFVEMGVPIKDVKAILNDYLNTTRNITVSNTNLDTSNKNVEKSYRGVKQAIDSAKGAQLDWATVVTNTASTLMNVGMVMMQVSSLMDTLNNPDTSGWEKFTMVLITLGMIVPSLLMVFKSFGSILKLETIAKIANAAATMGQVAAERKLNREKNKASGGARRSIKQTWNDTKEKVRSKGRNIKDTWNESAMQKDPRYTQGTNGQWYMKGKKGAMSKAEVGAAKSAAGKQALAGLGANVAMFAALAASVAILAVGIKAAIDIYNEHETRAQAAADAAKALGEKYNEVKTASEEFNSTLSNYEKGVEGLDKLTKGTTEYKQAVLAANEEAMKLIEANEDLQYHMKDGLIVLDNEQEIQQKKFEEQIDAQQVAMQAKQDAKNKQIEADMKNFNRRYTDSKGPSGFTEDDKAEGVAAGAGAGAAAVAGTMAAIGAANGWNPVGWGLLIAAAVVGTGVAIASGVKALTDNDAIERENKALELLQREYRASEKDEAFFEEDNMRSVLEQAGYGDLADSLIDNKEQTKELIKKMAENTEASFKNTNALLAQTYGDEVSPFLTTQYETKQKAYLDDYYTRIDATGWGEDYTEGGMNDLSLFIDEYKRLTNKELDLDDNEIQKNDKGQEVIVLKDGTEILMASMASEMAQIKAEQAVAATAIKVEEKLNQAELKFGTGISEALTSFISSQDLGTGLTEEEFNRIQESIGTLNKANITDFLEDTLGYSAKEIADMVSYFEGDVNLLVKTFTTEILDKNETYDNLLKEAPEAVKNFAGNLFDNKFLEKATLGEQQKVANLLSDAFAKGGQAGLDQLSRVLSTDIPTDKLDEYIIALGEIDWHSAEVDTIKDLMSELGIETSATSFEIQNLINTMSGAVQSFEELAANIGSLIDFLGSLNVGDTVDAEKFAELKDQGLAEYFQVMYDGTYQLIDATNDLKAVMKEKYIEKAEQMISDSIKSQKDAEERAAAIDKLGLSETRLDSLKEGFGFKSGYSYKMEGGKLKYTTDSQAQKWSEEQLYELNDNINRYEDYGDANQATILMSLYEDAMGWDNSVKNWDSNAVRYGDEDRVFVTANGKEIKVADMINTILASGKNAYLEDTTSQDKLTDMLSVIEAGGGTVREDWRNLEKVANNQELQDEILEAYNSAIDDYSNLAKNIEEAQKQIYTAQLSIATTAENTEQLQLLLEEEKISEEIYEYRAMQLDTVREMQGIDTKEMQNYAKQLEKVYPNLAKHEGMSQKTARTVMRMNKGIEALNGGLEDWSSIMRASSRDSEEYLEALTSLRTAMADILGVSEDSLSEAFLNNADNLTLMEAAATGSEEAIEKLAMAAQKDYILNLDIDENSKTALQNLLDNFSNQFLNMEVGLDVNDEDFIKELNRIATAAGMTADQIQEALNFAGMEAKFKMTKQEITGMETISTGTGTWEETDGGFSFSTTTRTEQKPYGTGEFIEVPGEIETITKTSDASMNNSSSKNPGGEKKENKAPEKRNDIVERYKEINDQLDDVKNSIDDVNRQMDRLYGPARLQQMEKMGKLLEDEIALNKEKIAEAEEYLKLDQDELQKVAAEAGVEFTFDDNGNISNYDEVMRALEEYDNNYWEQANADGNWTETETEKYEKIGEIIDNIKNGIATYDETRELLEDLNDESEELFNQWQDNNYQKITYKVEIEIEIIDTEMSDIERSISKMEGDFGSAAEILALRMDDQAEGYWSKLLLAEETIISLQEKYDAKEISQADFIAGMKEQRQIILDNVDALTELADNIDDYYGDVLSMASEEISKYTDLMEHNVAVLDHYSSLMELMGKSLNYKKMGSILEGQAKLAEDSMAVSKAAYETFASQAAWAKEQYDAALLTGDEDLIEKKKNIWLSAQASANEAQDKMLADTEAWLEAEKAVVENKLNDLAQELENAFTGGMSFDFIATQMERAQSLQEEYLTTTNKIYETNKLINKAQQDIDKSSNAVAKRKLQEYQKETKQLQNKTKLSNYELEIQQMKYDLLLAEIALEEAQNAKSTVRLQRDNEGNFGYIYTADQSEIANAQQQYEDAQNALYNKGLEGAADYMNKYQQTMQEMYDSLNELHLKWLNGEFESWEEYQTERDALVEYYNEKLMDYSELYRIAISTDARVAEDSWTREFKDMIVTNNSWRDAINANIGAVELAFRDWEAIVHKAEAETALGDVAKAVKGVTDESDALRKALIGEDGKGGVVAAIGSELETINQALDNDTYGKWAKELGKVASKYEAVAKAAKEAYYYEMGYNPDGSKMFEPIKWDKDEQDKSKEGWSKNPGDTELEIKTTNGNFKGTATYDANTDTYNFTTTLNNGETKTFTGLTEDYLRDSDIKKKESEIPEINPNDLNLNGGEGDKEGIDIVAGGDDTASSAKTPYDKKRQDLAGYYMLPSIDHQTGETVWYIDDNGNWHSATVTASGTVVASSNGIELESTDNEEYPSGWYTDDMFLSEQQYKWIDQQKLKQVLNDADNFKLFYHPESKQFVIYDAYRTNSLLKPNGKSAGISLPATVVDLGSIDPETFSWGDYYTGQTTSYKTAVSFLSDDEIKGLSNLIIKHGKTQLSKFDTGGYTGEWGPEGKLALLHEKELILKPNDTSNFLSALGLLDNILLTLDQYSASAQLSGMLSSPTFSMNNSDTLEQNVHIEASFPNVEDRNEIEEAFNNLINRASQYANRK